MANDAVALLDACNLEFCYHQRPTVKNIDFRLTKGEIVAIIGPNGSGKSTLLKLIAGILSPKNGHILLNGINTENLSRREFAQFVGYLPQFLRYDFNYSVEETVSMGRFPHRTGLNFLQSQDYDIIRRCLNLTGVSAFANRKLDTLSGGERQRVFLASVLAQEPSLLLLDEPSTGLDFHHQMELLSLFQNLSSQGITIVFVTHEVNLAAIYSQRILFMHQGKVIVDDIPSQVIQPQYIHTIYGSQVYIGKHPQSNVPMIFPDLASLSGSDHE